MAGADVPHRSVVFDPDLRGSHRIEQLAPALEIAAELGAILDAKGSLQLPENLSARLGVFVEDQSVQARGLGRERGGEASRTRANNGEINPFASHGAGSPRPCWVFTTMPARTCV